MKYSLESLPELLGTRDFIDLCFALGVCNEEGRTPECNAVNGADLATAVRVKVIKHHREPMPRQRHATFAEFSGTEEIDLDRELN